MPTTVHKALEILADTRSLKEVRGFVRAALGAARLDERGRRLMILAIDEAVTNIVAHRAGRPGARDVEIRIDIDDVRVRVVIDDRGEDVDPGPLSLSDLEESLRREANRCVGIFVMRQVMDEVNYRFKKGFENELELIKFTS